MARMPSVVEIDLADAEAEQIVDSLAKERVRREALVGQVAAAVVDHGAHCRPSPPKVIGCGFRCSGFRILGVSSDAPHCSAVHPGRRYRLAPMISFPSRVTAPGFLEQHRAHLMRRDGGVDAPRQLLLQAEHAGEPFRSSASPRAGSLEDIDMRGIFAGSARPAADPSPQGRP